jgi:hypothetical protein
MADKSRIHKGDKGIRGYDPHNKRATPPQIDCPYCYFSNHWVGQVTKHMRENHWNEPDNDKQIERLKK